METSPIMDHKGFVRELEKTYRSMKIFLNFFLASIYHYVLKLETTIEMALII